MQIWILIIMVFFGIISFLKMFQYFVASQTTVSYPPQRVLRQRAIVMGGVGTVFILIAFIVFLFSS